MKILGIIILAMLLSGCNSGGGSPAVVVPVFQSVWAGVDWVAAYGQGVQAVAVANNLCYFDFPVSPGHVDYLIKRAPSVAIGQTITMKFTISGTGQIVPGPNSGNPPPRVRLFMQRSGDDFSGNGPMADYRQWSTSSVDLTTMGDYTLSQVVIADQWTGVYGQPAAPAAFAETVANMANIGFTFGADFAGHGDLVQNGTARFTLNSYEVT